MALWVHLGIVDTFQFLISLHVLPYLVKCFYLGELINHSQVQMSELAQTVLEQDLFSLLQLFSPVEGILKEYLGRLILKTGHLEGLDCELVLNTWCTAHAVVVNTDYLDWSTLIIVFFQRLFKWDGCACSHFLH